MKIIITEEQFKRLVEDDIVAPDIPNTMTFWHGGNLDDYSEESIAQKSGRFEYGPGLYLITKYSEAIKYAKGNRKLYMVTVEIGNDLDDTKINFDEVTKFINKYIIPSKRNEIIERLKTRIDQQNTIPGFIMNNLIINYDAIKPGNTKYLRQFYVNNGVDYNIVKNPFGWGETMMVLFNMKKIKQIKRVNPKDNIVKYDLHETRTANQYVNTTQQLGWMAEEDENVDKKTFLGYHSSKNNIKEGYHKGSTLDPNTYQDVIRNLYMEIISDYDQNLEDDDIEAMNDTFEQNGYGFTYVSDEPIEGSAYQPEKYKYGNNLYEVYGDGTEILIDDYNEINATIVASKKQLYFKPINT